MGDRGGTSGLEDVGTDVEGLDQPIAVIFQRVRGREP